LNSNKVVKTDQHKTNRSAVVCHTEKNSGFEVPQTWASEGFLPERGH